MKNKIIIGVGVVAILGVIAFVFITGKAHAPENGMSDQRERRGITEGAFAPMTSQSENGSGSFRKLLGLGKNLTCSVSYTSPDTTSEGTYEGTVYVSGQKMRMEFTTTAAGVATKSNVINDGTQGYMWSSSAQGDMAIKFPVDPKETQAQTAEQFSLDQNVTYSCKNWSVDESKFVPPSDLKFMDMSAMIQKSSPEITAEMKKMQCATCNQVSDTSAKAQCLQAFSCN